jgi:hypothetical protein
MPIGIRQEEIMTLITENQARGMRRSELIQLVARQSKALDMLGKRADDAGKVARVEALADKFDRQAAPGPNGFDFFTALAAGIAMEIRAALAGDDDIETPPAVPGDGYAQDEPERDEEPPGIVSARMQREAGINQR